MLNVCRVGLEDLDFDLMIIDITGNVVYEDNPHIMQSIAWVWTELLLSVASTNGSTKAILADIDRLRFKDEVYGYLQWEDSKSSLNDSGIPYLNPFFAREATTGRTWLLARSLDSGNASRGNQTP